jgi:hypothetical protein
MSERNWATPHDEVPSRKDTEIEGLRAEVERLRDIAKDLRSANDYDAGMGTTPGMWQLVSELLDNEKLPVSINVALEELCEGKARVVQLENPDDTNC